MHSIRPAAGLALLTALFMAGPTRAAGIYKWVDDQGHVHYSQVAPTGRKQTKVHVQKTHATAQQQPADVSSGSYAAAGARAPEGKVPPSQPEVECETIVCRANRLEAQRLAHEKALREARNPVEKPLTQAERNAKFEAERKAAQDKKLVEECKQRREVYCDKGPDEIRRQRQWKEQEAQWARQRMRADPTSPLNKVPRF